jgi:hypothetical protein
MIAQATISTCQSWRTYVAAVVVVIWLPCLPVYGAPAPDGGFFEEADLPENRKLGEDELIHEVQYSEDESQARFEIEAEAFTSRNNRSRRNDWVRVASDTNIVQDCAEEGKLASTTPGPAQAKTFLLSVGKNAIGAPNDIEYDGATVDYKLRITTPSRYRLYLRWAGKDDNTDSVYAMLLGQDGASPAGPDYFLYHGRALLYYDNWVWDSVGLRDQTHCGFAGRPKVAEWEIVKPGIYTIRLCAREQGTAVDTLVLQTVHLPPPGDPNDSSRGRKHRFPALR